MSKIKEIWTYVVGAVGLIIAGLVYYLSLKNREVNALKAQVDLADTSNKVTALETEIKIKRENVSGNSKEITELDKTLDKIKQKKDQIAMQNGAKNKQQIEDFWKEN